MRTGTSFASTPDCSFRRVRAASPPGPRPWRVTTVCVRLLVCGGRAGWDRPPPRGPGTCPACPPPSSYTASMATGYKRLGQRAAGSMATVPAQRQRVARARLGETRAHQRRCRRPSRFFTSLATLPIMTCSWPRRSFLPVRPQIAAPGPAAGSTPEMTFRKLRRPTNGSDTVLKAKAPGGFVSSMRTVTSSAMRKRPWLAGAGSRWQMSSMTTLDALHR